ncbi:hypothetical protein BJX66DRAFT_338314 [Aspergillus keveii]|uniref:Zn(II)2Cys6 transcription factor n=1 Tax=Aspergillus keveii TaxID=714993 RepID=A0ABR4G4U2_9EURO
MLPDQDELAQAISSPVSAVSATVELINAETPYLLDTTGVCLPFEGNLHFLSTEPSLPPSVLPDIVQNLSPFSDSLLDDTLILTGNEYHALYHYQNEFILDRLLKTPGWSTYSCILHNISHSPMPMHFLLALSSLDLTRRSSGTVHAAETSQRHLLRGSELLKQTMSLETSPDQASTLISWLLLYLCATHRESINWEAANRVSQTALDYLKRHILDAFRSTSRSRGYSCNTFTSKESASTFQESICLIARLTTFLILTDWFTSFEGCGGHISRYLASEEHLYWSIFALQEDFLEQFWGASYPERELVQDVEVSSIVRAGHKVLLLIQEVHDLSYGLSTRVNCVDLKSKIIQLDTTYSSVTRLARSPMMLGSQLHEYAGIVLAFMNFARIYHFRVAETGNPTTPPEIVAAMMEIMETAHRTFSSSSRRGFNLLELPLFMLGLESKDSIHREWILQRLPTSRYRLAMERIVTLQQQTNRRVSIAEMREFLRDPSRVVSPQQELGLHMV